MRCNLLGILLALTLDKWSNLFLGVPGELFERVPLSKELRGLLRLLVLADVVGGEELKRLVELVEV